MGPGGEKDKNGCECPENDSDGSKKVFFGGHRVMIAKNQKLKNSKLGGMTPPLPEMWKLAD